VRVFWWRVLHGFLPARHVLHRPHIEKDASCEVCGTRYETIKHVLMDCSMARLFWEDARTITGVKLPRLHERTWARDLLQPDICPRKNAAVILCGMWSLWMMRNKLRHGEAPLPVRQALEWVRTSFYLWHLLHPQKPQVTRQVQRWKAPPGGRHKCNVDGAFFTSCNSRSTSVILRDYDGRFMAGRATRSKLACDALMMEALACRDGIQMAQELRITKLCLETDCLELINLWKALGVQRSVVSLIIHDIRCISRSFSEFTFMCTNRTYNRVAHEYAR
jgi:hypothetical protein